jgi:outer membrane lipoprotein SlyB
MTKMNWIVVFVVAALLTGCASSKSGEVDTRDQARQAQTVQLGTVEFVSRP